MAHSEGRLRSAGVKQALAGRLREIRLELFGKDGVRALARQLGIPARTWHNYEAGITVPAEVVLKFEELSRVEPAWLLSGRGPRYREGSAPASSERPHLALGSMPDAPAPRERTDRG